MIIKKCFACGEPWEGTPGSQPGRDELCPKCGTDVHCCSNCRLYDPSASRQCLSRTTEGVSDKIKRNFCDEFEIATTRSSSSPLKDDLDKKWKDLFGG